MCSQILINLKHIQKLEILYEFDVRFHTKVRSPICHVLLDVQNTHRRALRPGSDAVLHMSRIEFEFRPTQINLDRLN